MTDKKEKSDKLEKHLTTDEEFIDLVSSAFESEGNPVDVLGKKRTWQELEARTKDLEPDPVAEPEDGDEGDRFWYVGLALAACVILSVVVTYIRPMIEPDQGIKGPEAPVPVEMNAYVYSADGELVAFRVGESRPPVRVVPMVESTQHVYAALLSISEEGVPRVVIARQEFNAGDEQGFDIGGDEIFAVDWSGAVREVYCVVAFAEEEDLIEELARLQQDEAFTFDGNCLVLPEAK